MVGFTIDHATIIYRPGKKHGNADAISRLIHTRREEHDDEPEKKTRVIFLLIDKNGFMLAIVTEWNDTYTMGDQKTDTEIQWVVELIEQNGDVAPTVETSTRNEAEYLRKYNNSKLRDGVLYFSVLDKRGRIIDRFVVPENSRNAVMVRLHSSVFAHIWEPPRQLSERKKEYGGHLSASTLRRSSSCVKIVRKSSVG